MRKIKAKKQEPALIEEETSYSLKSVIIIIFIIGLVFTGFYFLTTIVVNNQSTTISNDSSVKEEYQTEKILFGQLLTRKESEYYVYAYDENSKSNSLHNQYLNDYNKKDGALEVYRIDLNDGMNKEYISNNSHIEEDLTNLKVSGPTLFKVKDGKIIESYVNIEVGNALKKLVS